MYFDVDKEMEWCNDKPEKRNYNTNPSYFGGTNPNAKAVLQIDMNGVILKEYGTVKEAAMASGAIEQSICRCTKGKGITAGGFKWKYKNNLSCHTAK